jgi:hypothetical protein
MERQDCIDRLKAHLALVEEIQALSDKRPLSEYDRQEADRLLADLKRGLEADCKAVAGVNCTQEVLGPVGYSYFKPAVNEADSWIRGARKGSHPRGWRDPLYHCGFALRHMLGQLEKQPGHGGASVE